MINKVIVKKPNLETVKNLTSKKLIEEYLRRGGNVQICKPKIVRKTWSDCIRGGRQRIGRIDGNPSYVR